MKPSKKSIKLRRSKRSTNLLKCVLQNAVYEKLPVGRRYRNSILTNCKGSKMSAPFMRLANSIVVRLDLYCKKYTSIHGKSNSRLLDVIERINGMLAEEGFKGSVHDDFDSWSLSEDASQSDRDRTLFEASEEIDTRGVASLMEQRMCSPLVSDTNGIPEGLNAINESVDSTDELRSWTFKLKATITSFIDHTWKYKTHKEIIVKEIIMNLLDNCDVSAELPVSSLEFDASNETRTTGFEDETVTDDELGRSE